jgi:predicted metal-dependent phosphoesterase TrpH
VPEFHSVPYIYLAGLSHKIGADCLGAFSFRSRSQGTAKLVDDDDLQWVQPPRSDTIGCRSRPHGPAEVEVRDESGAVVAMAMTSEANQLPGHHDCRAGVTRGSRFDEPAVRQRALPTRRETLGTLRTTAANGEHRTAANEHRSVIKVELHAHTGLDPADYIPHTTRQLIDHAAALGYGAIAITLHNRYYDPLADREYARERGVVLIPGIERTIGRRHIILLNFPSACAAVASFDDLRALKRQYPQGLVIAPHPFYPIASAIRSDADRYRDLIDAVEVNSMFTRWLNFNRRAIAWAQALGKPLVGNTDLHLLEQLGTTYSLVDAAPDPDNICAAIREGRVEVRSSALPTLRAAWIFGRMLGGGVAGWIRSRAGRAPGAHAGHGGRGARDTEARGSPGEGRG